MFGVVACVNACIGHGVLSTLDERQRDEANMLERNPEKGFSPEGPASQPGIKKSLIRTMFAPAAITSNLYPHNMEESQ